MKKMIVWILFFAIVLTCCGCGGQDPTQETTLAPTEETKGASTNTNELTPEQMYGHIDQTVLMDGAYKLWNAEGVKSIADHPDAKFELLCNIDMGGAVIAPIGSDAAPFTGKLVGGNFTISNFTVQGGDNGSFGFIAVNDGSVRNLTLENVTFLPAATAKNIGTVAGINNGKLNRCVVKGAMTVEQAAEGANCGSGVGVNTDEINYGEFHVDLHFTAPVAANVGGIAGKIQGGKMEYVETHGMLQIEGDNKSVGLFAGEAADIVMSECVFVGAANTLNGELFINFTGNPDDDELAVALNAGYRDNAQHAPLTEGQEKLRNRVVEEMKAMATVQWRLHEGLKHTCTCTMATCNGTYNTTTTYYGIPYNHKGGSLARMKYVLDEDGYIKDWLYDLESYDGFDLYMGNDCSTSLAHAWWTVSNSTDFSRCQYEIPHMTYYPKTGTGESTSGVYPVGEYNIDFTLNSKRYTIDYLTHNTEQEIYEAYGAMRRGDAYVYINELGGHTRMASADAVVVRKQNGDIDPKYSYVLSTEQGSPTRGTDENGDTYSNWKVDYKYTFANLYYDTAIPVTCEELITGEMEPATCELLDGAAGYAGMFNGTVKANYYLDSVDLEVKDSNGETVFFHTMWTTADKRYDVGHPDGLIRNYKDNLDLVNFATPLSKASFEKGETYTYTITGHLHTYEDFVVKEDSFTFGTAQ